MAGPDVQGALHSGLLRHDGLQVLPGLQQPLLRRGLRGRHGGGATGLSLQQRVGSDSIAAQIFLNIYITEPGKMARFPTTLMNLLQHESSSKECNVYCI